MKTSDKRALREAAELLDADATCMKESHTVEGRWCEEPADQDARRHHNRCERIAKRLRAIADE